MLAVGLGMMCHIAQAETPAAAHAAEDGQWRGTLAAGASLTGGSSRTRNLSLDAAARAATPTMRWTVRLKAQHSRDGDSTATERLQLGGRHDRNLSLRLFGFVGADAETDRVAGIAWRLAPSAGLGWKLVQGADVSIDAIAGVSGTVERYRPERVERGRTLRSDRYASGLLGLESSQSLGQGLSLRQRLALRPALRGEAPDRAEFDAALLLALTGRTALNVAYSARREGSAPGAPSRTDTVFTTGLSVRFE
jgi:putative salt-induced outer membrane protein YdiY